MESNYLTPLKDHQVSGGRNSIEPSVKRGRSASTTEVGRRSTSAPSKEAGRTPTRTSTRSIAAQVLGSQASSNTTLGQPM